MTDDICADCLDKLKRMHNAQAAHAQDPKNAEAKKEIEALKADGVPEDVGDEVRDIINRMISQRNEIVQNGGGSVAPIIDSYISAARSHLLAKEYDVALDNALEGMPALGSAYNTYVYSVQATSKAQEVEEFVQIVKAAPSKASSADAAKAKAAVDVLSKARTLISDKRFEEASKELASLDIGKGEEEKGAVKGPGMSQADRMAQYDDDTVTLSDFFNERTRAVIDQQKAKKNQEKADASPPPEPPNEGAGED